MRTINWTILLGLASLFIIIFACQRVVSGDQDQVPKISYSDLLDLLENEEVFILDIRTDSEVAAGMIPGAKQIPLAQLRQRVHEIPKTGWTVLYCASGNRVKSAIPILKAAGVINLYNFVAYKNWQGKIENPD